jgi:uncharacterized LabA/DUF88 family protein
MQVFVDFDNTRAAQHHDPVRLINDIVGALAPLVPAVTSIHFRLYGGWDTFGGRATTLAQSISAKLQAALPYSVRGPASSTIAITAELVRESLWLPVQLIETYRPRHPGQRGLYNVVPTGCPNSATGHTCQLHASLAALTQASCSVSCVVQTHEAIARNEQKQVDTCIVADLVHQAMMSTEAVALVSSDDDLWPGIFAAANLGKPVVHIHTRSPSACSQHYQSAVVARGHSYQTAVM